MLYIDVNVDCVKNILQNTDVRKACGPDNISGIILRESDDALAFPLNIIFNKCLNSGVFPSVYKTANVITIHKGEDKNIVN